jgi:AcrR family transcriptional regulator
VARPKSEDKRNAILDAATDLFAERGLAAAPTTEISRRADVAEGTLFTYFETKDDLINSLYREIKLELADAMMSDFPRKKNVRTRLRHVWDRYVTWGIFSLRQECGKRLGNRGMRGWWPFLPAVMPGVELISATRISTRGRMTNGQLTGNRRAQTRCLPSSLISAVKSMAFARLPCIQAESSPTLFGT